MVFWAVPGAASSVYGQSQPRMVQSMTDSLAYLQLTDKQKQEAMGLNIAAVSALVKLKQKAKADTSLKGVRLLKQMIGIFQSRNSRLSAILLPGQQELFAQHAAEQMAYLAAMKQKMEEKRS